MTRLVNEIQQRFSPLRVWTCLRQEEKATRRSAQKHDGTLEV